MNSNSFSNDTCLIEQIAFEIPLEIKKGLIEGELKLFGAVVRVANGENKGQIVAHLKPIDDFVENDELDNKETVTSWEQIVQLVKDHKMGVAIASGVVVLGAGMLTWFLLREPKYVKSFKTALVKYIDEIEHANLTVETIDLLMESIEEMEKHKRYKKKLSVEYIAKLVNKINQYTTELFEKNGIEQDNNIGQSDDSIVNFMAYLEQQRKLVSRAV